MAKRVVLELGSSTTFVYSLKRELRLSFFCFDKILSAILLTVLWICDYIKA